MKFLIQLRIFNNSSARQSIRTLCNENNHNKKENYQNNNGKNRLQNGIVIGTILGGGVLGYKFYNEYKNKTLLKSGKISAGSFLSGLATYSLDDVAKHNSVEKRIWVTYKHGVYDITDFISKHPGGEQILLAAGSSVEPFWLLYAAHNNPQVYDVLEAMRIGNISDEDSKEAVKDLLDPYCNDPKRHNILKPASVKPFNAEPPSHFLVDNFITPNQLFYVRNHLPVPEVNIHDYELEIELEGQGKKINLTLDEIKKFPKYTVTATIMCAGNRRSEMTQVKSVKGLSWQNGAVGNARWTGARLRDVLKQMGINEDMTEYRHIQFEGLDTDPTNKPYGASIPFWKGIDVRGDVLLAYEMNEEPIPRDHGFPIRVIVPGVVGARNVKWLGKIILSSKESDSHWQQNDYKGFSPSTDWDTVDFSKSPAIQELPVMSSICKPSVNDKVKVIDGHILIQGYAWSGGGQKIIRVDVTADRGKTWHVANFEAQDDNLPPQHWAWTLWSAKIPIEEGIDHVEVWSKAVDSSYNTQPESFKNIWNLRGVLSNAYHRVPIHLIW